MEQPGFFSRLSGFAANALRYWELRRLIYNAALATVVVAHVALAWPVRMAAPVDVVLGLFFLAVLANVAYCAVYIPDIFVQFAGLDAAWRKGRAALLVIGTAFAATIVHFIVKGFLGS